MPEALGGTGKSSVSLVNAGSADNLTQGNTGQIPYQITTSMTAFTNSLNGVFISDGINPSFVSILPVLKGGTGNTSLTQYNLLVGNGTSATTFIPPVAGTTGFFLTSNGLSANPSFQLAYPELSYTPAATRVSGATTFTPTYDNSNTFGFYQVINKAVIVRLRVGFTAVTNGGVQISINLPLTPLQNNFVNISDDLNGVLLYGKIIAGSTAIQLFASNFGNFNVSNGTAIRVGFTCTFNT